MRTPHAHLLLADPDGQRELDLYRCAHCQAQVPAKGERGWCYRCAALICVACARTGRCSPIEKRLEASERRAAFLRSVGVEG